MNARVIFVTRYETRVHARNHNADYGVPVVVCANTRREAVDKAIAVGWNGHPDDARVTVRKVTQEPVVLPAADGESLTEQALRAAEQNGREDNADHGMCYVAGSPALAAKLAAAWDEGAAKGAVVGMDAISLNQMHANPYREEQP